MFADATDRAIRSPVDGIPTSRRSARHAATDPPEDEARERVAPIGAGGGEAA